MTVAAENIKPLRKKRAGAVAASTALVRTSKNAGAQSSKLVSKPRPLMSPAAAVMYLMDRGVDDFVDQVSKYAADDLSGADASMSPGRWNSETQPVLYTAPTISLAVLETAAHIDTGGLPLKQFLVRIEVPVDVWKRREEIDVSALAPTWSAIPAGQGSVRVGSDWLKSLRSPILLVPSVIVPEERAVLINPLHAQAKHITARIERAFEYDRLFRAGAP